MIVKRPWISSYEIKTVTMILVWQIAKTRIDSMPHDARREFLIYYFT